MNSLLRLAALRHAATAGMADIEAGHFQRFDTPDALDQHLAALTTQVIGA